LQQKYSYSTAVNFLTVLKELPNVYFVQVYFYWNILSDADDNKFLDCYIASSANYLITNDRGFNKLKTVDFPKVHIASIEDIKVLIQSTGEN
jgi:putative PIN family toxin of toxin-antitoxin system